MATIPTPDEGAREILSILVYDVRMRPNEGVPPNPLKFHWGRRGYRVEDLWPGLDRAIELGWIAEDKLTTAGFGAAEPMELPARGTDGPVLNIHGNVGAVQTGSHATAHVSMTFGDGAAELVAALKALREEIEKDAKSTPMQREERAEMVEDAIKAVTAQKPNRLTIISLLRGLGTVVRTAASLHGAWALVHSAAASVGLTGL